MDNWRNAPRGGRGTFGRLPIRQLLREGGGVRVLVSASAVAFAVMIGAAARALDCPANLFASTCSPVDLDLKGNLTLRTDESFTDGKLNVSGKGFMTDRSQFGPIQHEYALCLYDQVGSNTSRLRMTWHIPASNWLGTTSGIKYKSKDGAPDGITSVTLAMDRKNVGKIKIRGKGIVIPAGLLPLDQYSGNDLAAVAVVNSVDVCFVARFSLPTVNTQFRYANKFTR